MQTIKAYLYPNIVEVQFLDPTIFTVRNRVVYSNPIKVYQGIDNPLQIVVKNQDQKPVNLTSHTVQLDIQDPLVQGSIASLAVNMTNIAKGQGIVTIPKDLLNSMEQRIYKITIKAVLVTTAENCHDGVVDSIQEKIMYIDDNHTATLDLIVLPGWYESTTLTPLPDQVIDGGII